MVYHGNGVGMYNWNVLLASNIYFYCIDVTDATHDIKEGNQIQLC